MRRTDLFVTAFKFCDELFAINGGEEMGAAALVDYLTCILSIVLSHHYQKEEVLSMVRGTSVDFAKVRDTMYKYSKKA